MRSGGVGWGGNLHVAEKATYWEENLEWNIQAASTTHILRRWQAHITHFNKWQWGATPLPYLNNSNCAGTALNTLRLVVNFPRRSINVHAILTPGASDKRECWWNAHSLKRIAAHEKRIYARWKRKVLSRKLCVDNSSWGKIETILAPYIKRQHW